jgi:uncharacterized protein (TIGR00725 family)
VSKMNQSSPAEERTYVSVIGAGTCDTATRKAAEEVGRLLARAGAVVVTGGMSGVMEAASRGARSAGGFTVGILPGLDRTDGNPFLDLSICTGIGHARNLAVAASGDAVIAVGGEYGTLSEIGLSLKTGKIVVSLGSWDVTRKGKAPAEITVAATPDEAVQLALASL